MRPHQRINSLYAYAITTVLSLPLLAIIALILLQKTTVFIALYSLKGAFQSPAFVPMLVLEDFLHFSIPPFLSLVIGTISPLIPWVILGFSLYTKKKKWLVFSGLFILFYTLYGALVAVLSTIRGS